MHVLSAEAHSTYSKLGRRLWLTFAVRRRQRLALAHSRRLVAHNTLRTIVWRALLNDVSACKLTGPSLSALAIWAA